MLLLTRRQGEKIVIGDNEIVIEVMQTRGGQVRLGITAPKGVTVDREEIFVRKKAAEGAKKV